MKGKKIIRLLAIVLGIIGLLTAIVFAQVQQKKQAISGFDVTITNLSEGDPFLSEQDVKEILLAKLDSFVGKPTESIQLLEIERLIEEEVAVKNAEAFLTVDSKLKLEVALKTAIVRVKPDDKNGYYLDSDGKVMPWVSSFTPRVLSLNGWMKRYCIKTLPKLTVEERNDLLNEELYDFAKLVYNDEFWSKQLAQLYINYDGDVELIPIIGEQKIILGSFQDGEAKLEKLKLFYDQVVNKVGWTKYSEVNLKFENQIVCK